MGHRKHLLLTERDLKDPEADQPDAMSSSSMIYTIFKDEGGEYRWRLRAKNRITIAISGEGYKNEKRML